MTIADLDSVFRVRRLDQLLVRCQATIRALTGVDCDNAVLRVTRRARGSKTEFFTDPRYSAMVRRVAPHLPCLDLRQLRIASGRVGFEADVPHRQYLEWRRLNAKAELVDVAAELSALRARKTPAEIAGLRAAEELNCRIWKMAGRRFRPGMTERDMARIIRTLMLKHGDGEAFGTIVCVGANAAECHHEPGGTVWNGREPVLVDMGVKLDGFCSDLTRNLVPAKAGKLYRTVYRLVLDANLAAIAAAKPGMRARDLDRIARGVIEAGGFGGAFAHSLGHGVGYEIHEAPHVSARSAETLEPGMVATIEPGVYLEGNLGVRIEDMVEITEDGCRVLSGAAPKDLL